jgi:tRNA(Glu) U13 pseudouridine synthase TruD
MKIWIHDTKAPTHRIVKLNCEEHSNFVYLGDLNDNEIRAFFADISPKIDIEKNLKLIHYYGYLNLFVTHKA